MMPHLAANPGTASSFARAVVRDNQDPENLGRIRVVYPWFPSEGASVPSEWARVCQPYASSQHGFLLIPDVEDEVLVFFENGDLDHPIVIGSLYSAKNPPPRAESAKEVKCLRTRSGHLLSFNDSASGGITLQDKDGRKLEIQSQSKRIDISEPGGSRITIDDSGVTIHSSKQILLGEGASHALLHGDVFQQLFNAHTHPVGPAFSGPPLQPLQPTVLSQKVKSV
jgi:uncharacterized protein involved in type VI secretion and phage assembly